MKVKVTFPPSLIDCLYKLALLPAIAGLLVSCSQPATAPANVTLAPLSAKIPELYYQQAKKSGSAVYEIVPGLSLMTVHVGRDGPLAKFGHEHIVASHDISGYVDATAGIADLGVPLDRLTVDEPALREAAGLTTQPSAEDIAGTRRNMLTRVLETQRYPYALIHITRASSDSSGDNSRLSVEITLHENTRKYVVPAKIETLSDGLEISGEMTFRQSDFGITPFSILGGALQVKDEMNLQFHIIAIRK